MTQTPPIACPCGGKSFDRCCGPYLSGQALPETAEQLMRSRYSAFANHKEAYLLASWHGSTRPTENITDASAKWLGLQVKAAHQVADQATVQFVARCRIAGRGQRLEATSRFVRENGRWWYVDDEDEPK